jgi:hypothetical protein
LSIGEIILAFWIAGVALAMWKIWRPSYRIITLVDSNNILVTRPVLSTIVVLVIFTIFLPFMVIPLLIPNKLEEFVLGFIRGAEKIK